MGSEMCIRDSFGVPAVLTSDRGAQFTSTIWAELCTLLKIRHAVTTAYLPEANGMVERMHRRLKGPLRHQHVGGTPALGPALPPLHAPRGGRPVSSTGSSRFRPYFTWPISH